MKFRFATWNIGCGAGGYHGQSIVGIANWIASKDIAVCVLQEVDRFAKRSNFIDFPAFLERETGLRVFFKPSFILPRERDDCSPREYGNCILSRYPIEAAHHISLFLPNVPDDAHRREKEPRSGLVARLDACGRALWVATSHLAYSPYSQSSNSRKRQADKLVEGLRGIVPDADPLVFGGDLNASAACDDIARLNEFLPILTTSIGPTRLGDDTEGDQNDPNITIDHIGARGVKVIAVEKFDEAGLTNYSAVVADLELIVP